MRELTCPCRFRSILPHFKCFSSFSPNRKRLKKMEIGLVVRDLLSRSKLSIFQVASGIGLSVSLERRDRDKGPRDSSTFSSQSGGRRASSKESCHVEGNVERCTDSLFVLSCLAISTALPFVPLFPRRPSRIHSLSLTPSFCDVSVCLGTIRYILHRYGMSDTNQFDSLIAAAIRRGSENGTFDLPKGFTGKIKIAKDTTEHKEVSFRGLLFRLVARKLIWFEILLLLNRTPLLVVLPRLRRKPSLEELLELVSSPFKPTKQLRKLRKRKLPLPSRSRRVPLRNLHRRRLLPLRRRRLLQLQLLPR